MTTYAPVPAFAERHRHPRALVLIVGVHAAAIAAVMTVKMDLPVPWDPQVTRVQLVPESKPPPEIPPPQPKREPSRSELDQPARVVPIPRPALPGVDSIPLPQPGADAIIGSGPQVEPVPQPRPAPVRTGPRFATPDSLLKPPYPASKLRMDEEAVLRLRLTIDERGRVTAVEPVGSADRVFLSAARRHLMANWRYEPATEDGRAVASATVITLRFELEN